MDLLQEIEDILDRLGSIASIVEKSLVKPLARADNTTVHVDAQVELIVCTFHHRERITAIHGRGVGNNPFPVRHEHVPTRSKTLQSMRNKALILLEKADRQVLTGFG